MDGGIFLFFLYFFLWIIISMQFNLEIALTGALVAAAIYRFTTLFLRYKPGMDRIVFRNVGRGLRYIGILIFETVKANITVFKLVFSKEIQVEPRLVYFRTPLKSNLARVVLANSITLTPGTITVALNDGWYCVHCLNGSLADGIENTIFLQKLLEFER